MSGFLPAVRSFHAAVLARDETGQRQHLAHVQDRFATASDEDLYAAASLLSDVLHAVPPVRDAEVAVVIGACVERGTDPATCAEPVLHRAQLALEAAAEDCRTRTGPDLLPEPAGVADWEAAIAVVLGSTYIRRALLPRPVFLDATRTVAAATGAGALLARLLALLDDAPLVVVHRPSGEGFAFTMSGIADLADLHALLVDHVPEGDFRLTLPDGTEAPADRVPADLPEVGGSRLLVLDPRDPAIATPSFVGLPGVSAVLRLDQRLTPDAVARWTAHLQPAHVPEPDPAAAAVEVPARRPWWRRG